MYHLPTLPSVAKSENLMYWDGRIPAAVNTCTRLYTGMIFIAVVSVQFFYPALVFSGKRISAIVALHLWHPTG